MALKMSEFPKIDPSLLAKLRDAKIEDTDELMKLWSDKTKRQELIDKSGIGEEDFLKFAGLARLSRVRGMDLKYLNLLVAAGIDGPKRLFSFTPETLTQHLTKVVAEKKLTDPLPTPADLQAWFTELKKEPVEAK